MEFIALRVLGKVRLCELGLVTGEGLRVRFLSRGQPNQKFTFENNETRGRMWLYLSFGAINIFKPMIRIRNLNHTPCLTLECFDYTRVSANGGV